MKYSIMTCPMSKTKMISMSIIYFISMLFVMLTGASHYCR